MSLNPIDERYSKYTKDLIPYFSDEGINKSRVLVEIEWLKFLLNEQIFDNTSKITKEQETKLQNILDNFGEKDIKALAEIEKVTNHDVKAIEYYIKERLPEGIAQEIVHIFLTSEDINNLAYSYNLKQSINDVWLPLAQKLITKLDEMVKLYKDIPMLAKTHGQVATPTTLGKEIAVLEFRLKRQVNRINNQEFYGKFNGATGTYAAHLTAKPNIEWDKINQKFVESLGLTFNPLTTQIESYDTTCEIFEIVSHFNRVLHNLATDMWFYISNEVFKLKVIKGEIGSSAMPHKVNPINFENGEANLEMANGIFKVLIDELLVSRLQRDLTDSTLRRNYGVAFGYSLIAYNNILTGLNKLEPNLSALSKDLENHPQVLAEAIQNVMRVASVEGVKGFENPYEKLKELTRGKEVTLESIKEFVENSGLPKVYIKLLDGITPKTYIGLATKISKENI